MIDNLCFGEFELNRAAFQLRCGGHVVHLERIPLDILFLLAEHRGRLVGRQEIIDAIWGKHVVGDVDNGINTAIRKIRRALNDTTENPRFLFTVAGKGYRFEVPAVSMPAAAALPSVSEPADPGLRAEPAALATFAAPAELVEPSTQPSNAAAAPRFISTRGRRLLAATLIVLVGATFLASRLATRYFAHRPSRMLAVLPFLNLSGDPQQEYFADGMTEELIAQMGSLDPAYLRVIARTTAMQFKGTHKDVGQIARELGVDYILEGSVRNAGGRIRITGQLIEARGQTHIWAGSYDGELGDTIRLQSAVAAGIADKIRLTLPSPDWSSRAPMLNADAHDAYLRGLQALNVRTKEGFGRGIAEFHRAVMIDPNYAPAYAALGNAYSLASIFGGGSSADTMPKAREAALHALQLDQSLAEAHTTLGFVKAHYDYDWVAAEHEFRRALELNPSDAQAHLFYSNSYLSPVGRHAEAIEEIRKAIDLDPLSLPIQAFAGRTLIWARRYDQALAELQKAQRIHPNVALVEERLAHLYTYKAFFDKAIDSETTARMLTGETAESALAKKNELHSALASNGPRGYWETVLKFSLTPDNPPEAYTTSYGRAIVYARLGELKRAIAELDKAVTERQLSVTEIAVEPAFDPLRSDPEFSALVRRVGLLR